MRQRDNLRPKILEDYIGQEHLKDVLRTSILAAKGRNEPLDHVLLNGPPGLGKTTLALIIASEMGWKIKTIIAPSIGSVNDVFHILKLKWKPNTILFIDEVHRLRRPVQEVLYPILEDNKLQFDEASIDLVPLTIIGATTNIGRLERPFIDRFGLQFQLQYYSDDEISEILWDSAEKLKIKPTNDAIDAIARRSKATPRIANHLLKRIRDYSEVYQQPAVDQKFVDQIVTNKLHIDEIGLTPLDHRYLKILHKADTGLGVDAVATALNEEVPTVEDYIEPYLIRLGYVERRRNGRWLTEDGTKYLNQKKK